MELKVFIDGLLFIKLVIIVFGLVLRKCGLIFKNILWYFCRNKLVLICWVLSGVVVIIIVSNSVKIVIYFKGVGSFFIIISFFIYCSVGN